MMINYATTNKGKVQSLQRDLKEYGIKVIQKAIDIPEPRSNDVSQIAMAKSKYAFEELKEPVVVLDAGFYIYSLNGFPRAFANFAIETIGLEGILRLAEGKQRDCEFRECLAYLDDTLKDPRCFIIQTKGQLSQDIKGEMQPHLWSKLSRVFIPEGSKKTLAEMDLSEYLDWRRSLRKEGKYKEFVDWYIGNLNK